MLKKIIGQIELDQFTFLRFQKSEFKMVIIVTSFEFVFEMF